MELKYVFSRNNAKYPNQNLTKKNGNGYLLMWCIAIARYNFTGKKSIASFDDILTCLSVNTCIELDNFEN